MANLLKNKGKIDKIPTRLRERVSRGSPLCARLAGRDGTWGDGGGLLHISRCSVGGVESKRLAAGDYRTERRLLNAEG